MYYTYTIVAMDHGGLLTQIGFTLTHSMAANQVYLLMCQQALDLMTACLTNCGVLQTKSVHASISRNLTLKSMVNGKFTSRPQTAQNLLVSA